jgi:predicted nucleic acid-binding Zn ribbon protein
MLDGQPASPAKVAFAWRLVAGPTLAAATITTWSESGRLLVEARSEAWHRELVRMKPLLLEKLRTLLGPAAVTSLIIDAPR